MKDFKSENNNGWKGENASYYAFHQWLNRNFGHPKKCESCSIEGKKEIGRRWNIHYALIHGEKHGHDKGRYLEFCRVCHGKYDLTEEKRANLKRIATGKKGKSIIKSQIALARTRTKNGQFKSLVSSK